LHDRNITGVGETEDENLLICT